MTVGRKKIVEKKIVSEKFESEIGREGGRIIFVDLNDRNLEG